MFSTVVASSQSSVEDSDDLQTQVDFLNESTIHDPDSNSVKNSSYNTSGRQDVEVMIVYTSAASNWSSNNDGGIENTIGEAMDNINTAMENSEIDLDINLVHSDEVNYTETGDDLEKDIRRLADSNDGYMEEVHDWRDYYGADLVSLFVKREEDSPERGVATAPHEERHLHPRYGFSVVSVQSFQDPSVYVFTHEIGHNFGAGHAKDQIMAPGPQLYDYSAGWSWNGYQSVMTYKMVGDYESVLHFSNPDVYHEGDPTGCPEDGDNARTIRETKGMISDYQEPTPQIELLSPTGGEGWYGGAEYDIEWETVSGDNDVDGVDLSYSTDGGITWKSIAEGVPDTGNHTWEVPEEANSNALIKAEAFDTAGFSREDTSNYEFEILEDSSPPNLEIIEPMDGKTFEMDEELNVTIEWTGSDDHSGLDYFEINIDEGRWIEVGDSTNHTLEDLEEGEYEVTVRAVDRVGNIATESIEFEVRTPIFVMFVDLVERYLWIFFFLYAVATLVVFISIKRDRRRRNSGAGNTYNLALKDIAECGKCGTAIPGYLSECPKCGVEFSDVVQCKNCGSEIYDDVDECPECGAYFYLEDDTFR